MNPVDQLMTNSIISKEAGIINDIMAPIRVKNVFSASKEEARAANEDYIRKVRREILENYGAFEPDIDSTIRNESSKNEYGAIGNPVDSKVFNEMQKRRYIDSKIASKSSNREKIKEIMKESGFITDLSKPSPMIDENSAQREFFKNENSAQRDFFENVNKTETDRLITKIRSLKDKQKAFEEMMLRHPDMTKEQFNAMLLALK